MVQAVNPIVTRKDTAEAESPPRTIGLADVMRPARVWLLRHPQSALTNGFSLAWPAGLHGRARSLSLSRRDDHYLV